MRVEVMQDVALTADQVSPHPLLDLTWIRQATGKPELSLKECMQAQDRVGPNALLDVEFYRKSYGGEIPQGMSCLEHFCRQRRDRPYDPNPLFSMRQWHETLGWRVPADKSWRSELFSGLGAEARFARVEMNRQTSREVILNRSILSSPPAENEDICLFVHYDAQDNVQDYVYDYLRALKDQDVRTIFMTNSHDLSSEAIGRLKDYVWQIVYCDNRAYDWGLYAIGVQLLKDTGFTDHSILLANDSVIGTMNDLTPLFQQARSGPFQITGAVDSLLHDWHLQSFFIYCRKDLVSSPAWDGFWKAYRPASDRWFVVNGQEMGFSRWMTRSGVTIGAAWEYETLLDRGDNGSGSEWRREIFKRRQVTNPTIELWDVLLEAGFPFLKKALLTTPLMAGNISRLSNLIRPQFNRAS